MQTLERARLNGQARPANGKPAAPSAAEVNGEPPAGNGRASGGRFAAGNKHGRGNPHYRKLCQLRSAVLDVVDADRLRALFSSLLTRAMGGDNEAARLLLLYALGKPAPAADPDRADLHEVDLLAQRPTNAEVLAVLLEANDPATVADAVALKETDLGEVLKRASKSTLTAQRLATVLHERDKGK